MWTDIELCLISGFCLKVDQNCALLGYYTASSGSNPEECRSQVFSYRVSVKSFPDYKHLLQENYMEYKHIFLPLLNTLRAGDADLHF